MPSGLRSVALARGFDQLAAQLRIAQAALLLLDRQRADVFPQRQAIERHLRLERKKRAQRTGVRLREHAPAHRRRLVEQIEIFLPGARRFAPAEDAEGDRTPGIDGQIAQPRMPFAYTGVPGVAVHAFAGDLEQTGVQFAHRAHEPAHLVPAGLPARHRAAVGRLVARRARGREADGAGIDRIAHLAFHRLQVVFGRLAFESAFAHHECADRRMADVARIVDALGQRLERGEVFGIRGPAPLDAGFHRCRRDVLGALQVAHHEVLVLRGAGREREPAIAHHDRRDAVVAGAGADRIPEDLGVHVRVPIHESRGNDVALGVQHLAGALADSPDARDPAALNADVRAIAGHAGPVDHRAVLDHQVILHVCSPPKILAILHPARHSRKRSLHARRAVQRGEGSRCRDNCMPTSSAGMPHTTKPMP